MGIDYGSHKVGIALTDEAGTFAFPHRILPNEDSLLKTLAALVAENAVKTVVIGESKNLSGKDNTVSDAIHAFGEALKTAAGVSVVYIPEQFTSAHARRQFESDEKTRSPKQNPLVDASAAALILEHYLLTNH